MKKTTALFVLVATVLVAMFLAGCTVFDKAKTATSGAQDKTEAPVAQEPASSKIILMPGTELSQKMVEDVLDVSPWISGGWTVKIFPHGSNDKEKTEAFSFTHETAEAKVVGFWLPFDIGLSRVVQGDSKLKGYTRDQAQLAMVAYLGARAQATTFDPFATVTQEDVNAVQQIVGAYSGEKSTQLQLMAAQMSNRALGGSLARIEEIHATQMADQAARNSADLQTSVGAVVQVAEKGFDTNGKIVGAFLAADTAKHVSSNGTALGAIFIVIGLPVLLVVFLFRKAAASNVAPSGKP